MSGNNAISVQPRQDKSSARPTLPLDCPTKLTLRISRPSRRTLTARRGMRSKRNHSGS